jgi:hypothetical protein
MVATLRGRLYATPQDVMTYMKNFEGLYFKMTKTDAATIPVECVNSF